LVRKDIGTFMLTVSIGARADAILSFLSNDTIVMLVIKPPVKIS